MKELRKYDIIIAQLEQKEHLYEFEGGNAFFEAFEQELIQKGTFKATVKLDKSATMIQLWFDVVGEVELTCDRSLETFNEPFQVQEKLILKFGEKAETLSDEIEIIPRDTAVINIAQPIFDFIGLSIPIKKLHPRFRTDDADTNESNLLIYSTTNKKTEVNTNDSEATVDPRWAALKKLKDN
ncbi:MAG: DUF177 domain-containing protein [Spirosomataceae bacterium]